MQPKVNQTDNVAMDEVVTRSGLAARRIADDLSWGEGAIQPPAEHTNEEDERDLVDAVLENIEPVEGTEIDYSSCTDGRLPMQLLSGEAVPVREQMVGADMVSAFFVAEVLGGRFYANASAPVAERVADVAAFLHENGLLPSSHVACGAAAGFTAILQNMLRFGRDTRYIERVRALLPENVFNEKMHVQLLEGVKAKLDADSYNGLTADTFLEAARTTSGDRSIAELRDDGRGVRGHTEEAIMRLQLDGKALNGAKLARATSGRQVFAVNDTRMERLARIFSRGNDADYRLVRIALEAFADSGHGTLAKNLPTYVITGN